MTTALNHYLEIIRNNLRIDLAEEKEVISELETHIEDKLQELKECGLSEEEAESTCLGLLGSARVIARQIYEAHSQGSWGQAFLAAMPHLLFAALFALNWWHHIGWLSIILVMVIGTSIYGWWHGKPAWVFPWLGYSLVPVAAFGLILLYLPKEWSLLTVPFYFLFALWWLFCIVVQTAKRDWPFSSLMLLPLPIITGWFLTLVPDAKITAQTMYGARQLFRPLDCAELSYPSFDYSRFYSLTSAMAAHRLANHFRAADADHRGLLRWRQARCTNLRRTHPGNVGAFPDSASPGAVAQEEPANIQTPCFFLSTLSVTWNQSHRFLCRIAVRKVSKW